MASSTKVEHATLADAPALALLTLEAFDTMESIFPHSPAGIAWLAGSWTRFLDPNQDWSGQPEPTVLVVRSDDGTVASAALYFTIHPGQPYGIGAFDGRWMPKAGDPASAAAKTDFFDTMARNHAFIMADRKHVFLEVLMTAVASRKRGYATALLDWGDAFADGMGLEMYLDAAKAAKHLYEAHGYVEQDVKGAWEGDPPEVCVTMRRPAKNAA